MIVGVGIDVVPVERFAESLARTPGLRDRLFTAAEQRTAVGRAAHRGVAGRPVRRQGGAGQGARRARACTGTTPRWRRRARPAAPRGPRHGGRPRRRSSASPRWHLSLSPRRRHRLGRGDRRGPDAAGGRRVIELFTADAGAGRRGARCWPPLPEGALMQRAAAGLATRVPAAARPRSTARGCVLLVGAGDNGGDALYAGAAAGPRAAPGSRAVLLDPDRAHAAGLAALRAAGGRAVDRRRGTPGRRPTWCSTASSASAAAAACGRPPRRWLDRGRRRAAA